MKKLILGLALILVLTLLPVGLFGCNGKAKALSAKEFYAMGLATGVNYFENLQTPALLNSIDSSHKTTIEKYVGLFGGLMDKGIHPKSSQTNQEEDGAYATYAYKLTIDLGEKCTLYYDEVLSNTKVDKDETETESLIKGVVIKGAKMYYVAGGRSIETEVEQGKTETETELKMMISTSPITISNNDLDTAQFVSGAKYVILEEEFEENEYEYSYVTSDDRSNPVSIEWENRKGKEHLEIEIGTVEYEISKESETKFKIVKFENKTKTTFYLEKQATGYVYTNKDGQTV